MANEQSAPLITGYQRWREQQLSTRELGSVFEFCGERYMIDEAEDGRRILVGPTPRGYQHAA